MGGSTSMVSKDKALPGRAAPMKIAPKHFVLGTPMQGPWPEGHKVMIFANGCFWGSEKGAWRLPGGGIYTTAVGYAAGFTPNPTYEEACSGRSGHTEAVQLIYDPAVVSYEALCAKFWDRLGRDATSYQLVGNDRGPQYRAGIYTVTSDQLETARKSLVAQQAKHKEQIQTEVEAMRGFFWPAEEYHQQYLEKGGRFNSPQSAAKGDTTPIRCYG